MKKNFVESLIGLAIIVIAISFFVFAKDQAELGNVNDNNYNLEARFDKIDGINTGSDIRIAGIKIGSVVSDKLDLNSYEAVLIFSIRSDVKIPTDSIAAVVSSGLLGKKYISIEPGAEDVYLQNNQKIIYTQSSVNLESLIGKFMFKDGE